MKIVTFTVQVNNDDFSHAIDDAKEAVAHADIKRGKILSKGSKIKIEVKEPYTPKAPSWKSKRKG